MSRREPLLVKNRFRSAPHRVINKTGAKRHSIPFFTATRSDVKLECLPTCKGSGVKCEPISYGEYIAEVNKKNYDFLAEKK